MRRRGWWGVGAAAGVVVIAGVVALGGGFLTGATRASADSVAPFVVIAGRPVPYDRPQPWTSASTTSRNARDLTVFATGAPDSGGGACGPPALRFRVTETATAVEVLVADYQAAPGLSMACPAIGYGPSPHLLRLQRPLGSRDLIDASTGRRAILLVGTDHPILTNPPAGLAATALTQRQAGDPVTRDWYATGTGDFPAISLIDQAPRSVRTDGPYGRVALQTQIHGTPATIYQGVGAAPGTWFAQWTPNNRQTITLRVAAAGRFSWNAASTLALARTVTGYTTDRTDRLGEPDVHGTVAATYNSADGPVRNASNLLKSSGVYVGLNCAGSGRLAVTIRGRTTAINCTPHLNHHEFESTGAPSEPFTLRVHATAGVRWSLSLARKTLDGS